MSCHLSCSLNEKQGAHGLAAPPECWSMVLQQLCYALNLNFQCHCFSTHAWTWLRFLLFVCASVWVCSRFIGIDFAVFSCLGPSRGVFGKSHSRQFALESTSHPSTFNMLQLWWNVPSELEHHKKHQKTTGGVISQHIPTTIPRYCSKWILMDVPST